MRKIGVKYDTIESKMDYCIFEPQLSEIKFIFESEIKILNLINNDVTYKTKDLVKITNFSEAYINKIIRSLKDKRYIERIGANKNGHWNILK